MPLPSTIPSGARVVVRTAEGRDPADGRMKYRDYVGHVISWDGRTLKLNRDASANGERPAQSICLQAASIVALKPIPERPEPKSGR
ncbi:hypothetical protein CRD60_03560 [Bifidobacterium aemilianum]|uniref:Uncharacterized protein n=1 Tax=Bifidobacterium aemilianum TaxID=2493120 RepID=A0A366KCB6_9BIFI|nr:DUF6725 family protein [Bifidobacterium aemilianum]RBP98301.1 hypothetical protein CRD60_03560 [Bifidobacterium aemilianum]